MSRRLGGVEQRLTRPDVFDVADAQMWVLEQVADLVIDLEGPFIVEEIGIEPFHSHPTIVLQVTTDDYVLFPQVDPSPAHSGPILRRPSRGAFSVSQR